MQIIAEQLASQHARILHYQQQQQESGSSGWSSEVPDMCMEKIVEQQLRIKQVYMYICMNVCTVCVFVIA